MQLICSNCKIVLDWNVLNTSIYTIQILGHNVEEMMCSNCFNFLFNDTLKLDSKLGIYHSERCAYCEKKINYDPLKLFVTIIRNNFIMFPFEENKKPTNIRDYFHLCNTCSERVVGKIVENRQ